MKNKYQKEEFENIVKNSYTISEICNKLGLNKTGGAHSTVKKYIKIYNIDISHFHKPLNGRLFLLQELSEILIEKSKYTSTNHLKNRLYKEGLKSRKCELCGQGEEWKGKKMSLILDHINGVNDDHRLENLRIVCPNCNATLETHCRGKKIEKIKKIKKQIENIEIKCEDCNDILYKKTTSGLCKKCYDIKQRKVKDRPDKETLIKSVKLIGYSRTGKNYDVSSTTIKKWLTKI